LVSQRVDTRDIGRSGFWIVGWFIFLILILYCCFTLTLETYKYQQQLIQHISTALHAVLGTL
jgi:hypothetical protein